MATLQAAPTSHVTLNNSVEYLPTNAYLALTSRGREGWEKPKYKMACKQQAIKKHFAKNYKQEIVYTSHEVPLLDALGHPQYSWKNC